MTRKTKTIIFIVVSSILLFSIIAYLGLNLEEGKEFKRKVGIDSSFLYKGDYDGTLIVLNFEEKEKDVLAKMNIYSTEEDLYLYKIYEEEKEDIVQFNNQDINIPVLSNYLGKGLHGTFNEKEIIFVDEEEKQFTFRKLTEKKIEEEIKKLKGRIAALNNELSKDEDSVKLAEELKKKEEEIESLSNEFFNVLPELEAAIEVIIERTSTIADLIDRFEEGEKPEGKLGTNCEENFDFYCDILTVKEYINDEFKGLDAKYEKAMSDLKKGDKVLREYNEKITKNTFSPRVSYDDNYYQSMIDEAKEVYSKYKKAREKFDNLYINFEAKYVK